MNITIPPRNCQHGFTLVEIMIVVAIIGLVAALALPGFAKARRNSQTQKCIANQRIIFQAVIRYEADFNTTLRSIKDDGAAITKTLVGNNYVKHQGAFECPSSQTKDYDDILLLYSGNDFTNTSCTQLPAVHTLQ